MKLCDRCRVPGCCLDYLGKACQSAREQECPDIQPNRAEQLTNGDIDELTEKLHHMLELFEDDFVPDKARLKKWLLEEKPL